jgi:hypothetical protein
MRRIGIVAGLVLAGVAGFLLTFVTYVFLIVRTTTTTRLSPDETILARLVETSPSWHIDRNFVIRLESLVDGKKATIFHSPDEGHTVGTERLLWSKDGTKLLLVGRHFFVKEDLFLDNGDQLYFLYDLPSGKAWCNADHSELPALKAELVRGIEFTEPVVLKEK